MVEPITAMTTTKSVQWKCLVGRISKWKEPKLFSEDKTLEAKIVSRSENDCIIEFNWSSEEKTFSEVLESLGNIPIPPYLKRESESIDTNRYQTVYANHKGSVAAPTAGLHFTQGIFESFKLKSIKNDFVTLHVGAGTFKQVKSKTLEGHEMHSEWIDVKIETIENILACVKKFESQVIAVGTTSLRTIESLYWMGVKASLNPDCQLIDLEIKQWNPYELPNDNTTENALTALVSWMKKNALKTLVSKTQLLIVPNYELKVADALITNFHQPNSTLLLIVAAVTGEDWRGIYNYALENDFRFLSYGDGSLLFKNKSK
jgi:S-adenosylmethionine:tRNA ribosyltransferase-isomerase